MEYLIIQKEYSDTKESDPGIRGTQNRVGKNSKSSLTDRCYGGGGDTWLFSVHAAISARSLGRFLYEETAFEKMNEKSNGAIL